MAALDLLGRRWSLRVLWELRSGPVGARALLKRCESLSSSVLYDRVHELSGAGLIEKNEDGDYRLTKLGSELGAALGPLDTWARRWAKRSGAGLPVEPWYAEAVVDEETGEVVHSDSEPLAKHTGHGSDKPRRRRSG